MALSNIRIEPRREITESLVGIAVVGVLGYLDYLFARSFMEACNEPTFVGFWATVCSMVVGVIAGVLAVLVGLAFLHGTHALGDWACNILQNRGIYMRPVQRYRRTAIGIALGRVE